MIVVYTEEGKRRVMYTPPGVNLEIEESAVCGYQCIWAGQMTNSGYFTQDQSRMPDGLLALGYMDAGSVVEVRAGEPPECPICGGLVIQSHLHYHPCE